MLYYYPTEKYIKNQVKSFNMWVLTRVFYQYFDRKIVLAEGSLILAAALRDAGL